MKNENLNDRLEIKINKGDKSIIRELREKYSVNISSFIRVKIRELYEKTKNND